MKYGRHVSTDLTDTANEILEKKGVSRSCEDPVKIAFNLHRYTHKQVKYESRHDPSPSRRFRSPLETLENGGNCEEQSVLLASLLESKDVRTQVLALEPREPPEPHLSLRCYLGDGTEHKGSQIRELLGGVAEMIDTPILSAIADPPRCLGKVRMYYADPEFCRYLGDPGYFQSQGYMKREGTEWLCERSVYTYK